MTWERRAPARGRSEKSQRLADRLRPRLHDADLARTWAQHLRDTVDPDEYHLSLRDLLTSARHDERFRVIDVIDATDASRHCKDSIVAAIERMP